MGMRRSFNVTNIVTNGDFSKGTTGWAAGASVVTAALNHLIITGNGGSSFVPALNNTFIPAVTGKKLYLRGVMIPKSADCKSVFLQLIGTTGGAGLIIGYTANPVQDVALALSGVATLTNQSGNIRVDVVHSHLDAATANGKIAWAQEIIAIDISTLPEEIKAMSDVNIKTLLDTFPWFNGTLSGGSFGGLGGLK